LRITGAALAATIVLAALYAASAGALIGIYRNPMETGPQRGEALKMDGSRCARGGSAHAFKIVIGKQTRECTYRTPVVGRDLEIAATGRLLSKTPKQARNRAYLSLVLRAGETARYALVVYPLQRKAQLRKRMGDGKAKFLRIAKKVPSIHGTDRGNKLSLRAFNVTSGEDKGRCRILAYVGKVKVAEYTDRASGDLQGRASAFGVGASKKAKGIAASFDDVVVRVPDPE
jgi:hypothetical protein